MVATTPVYHSHLQTPADALLLWLTRIQNSASDSRGLIFTTRLADSLAYMKAADRVMPPSVAPVVNTASGRAAYRLSGGGRIDIEMVANKRDCDCYALSHGRTIHDFLVFDQPARWFDRAAMADLITAFGQYGTHVVYVGSGAVSACVATAAAPGASGAIDYAAITREIAGGGPL